MNDSNRMQGALFRTLPVFLVLFVTGCATVGQGPDATPAPEPTEAQPAPPPQAEPLPEPPAVVGKPALFHPRVAVVLSARLPAYENVATELGVLLQDYSVYDLSDRSLTPREIFSDIDAVGTEIVFAIGLRAATVAKSFSQVPVVFCQVFNIADNDLTSARVKGVAALPPLALQVDAWKDLNPALRNIGAILGTGHDSLIDEAKHALESSGMKLHYRIAKSDREALYIFNRLMPDIEGFWLFPDNRILSPRVLSQMLTYASRHRVQVAVFNPKLLDLGATLSATPVESDIAATVVDVARGVISGDSNSIPGVTPLSEIDVQTSRIAAKSLALAAGNADGEDSP